MYLMRAVRPLVGFVHKALGERFAIGVHGLRHIQQVVLFGIDERVQPVVEDAIVGHRGDGPAEEVVVPGDLVTERHPQGPRRFGPQLGGRRVAAGEYSPLDQLSIFELREDSVVLALRAGERVGQMRHTDDART